MVHWLTLLSVVRLSPSTQPDKKREVSTNAPLFLGFLTWNIPGAKYPWWVLPLIPQPMHPKVFRFSCSCGATLASPNRSPSTAWSRHAPRPWLLPKTHPGSKKTKEVTTNAPLFLGLLTWNVPWAKVLRRAQSQNPQPMHPELFRISGSWGDWWTVFWKRMMLFLTLQIISKVLLTTLTSEDVSSPIF